jgi:pimeloyl-ACP methyl ester carboxylesterase
MNFKTTLFAAAIGLTLLAPSVHAADDTAIRPFHVHVATADLADLKQRVNATRWPDMETVPDASQGVQLANLQGLVRYWGTNYDWRKAEARLNALPMYVTQIDGIDIQFIHVRSRSPNALPVIITHGWPGSILEMTKVIDPLTNPTAHGGKAEDAFDVVIPSIPGYGFSGKPTSKGWDPDHIARVWDVLMKRLGYTRYVAQGGDWGAPISGALAREAPEGLIGIHLNLPAVVPTEASAALATGGPAPAGLSDEERAVFDGLRTFYTKGAAAYGVMMGARPQTLGYGVTDSPAGLAAWLLGHPGFAQWKFGRDAQQTPTKDEVLDDITLYWLTNSAVSSSRLYWENAGRSAIGSAAQKTTEIKVPVAITVFPEDVYRPPQSWAKRAYPTLSYYHQVDKGGHFAAWEQPELFGAELRAAFRQLR